MGEATFEGCRMKGSIISYYQEGWSRLTQHPHLIGVSVLYLIATILIPALPEGIHNPLLSSVLQLLGQLIVFTLTLGMMQAFLKVSRDEPSSLSDLFSGPPFIVPALVSGVAATLAIIIGFIALILPGIYIAIRLQFIVFAVLDGFGPMEALRKSWKMTAGRVWWLFGFNLLGFFINVLGLLFLIVGIVVTFPLTYTAQAIVYKTLFEEAIGREES